MLINETLKEQIKNAISLAEDVDWGHNGIYEYKIITFDLELAFTNILKVLEEYNINN